MRFFEFQNTTNTDPADDIAYLISNTNLSPAVLKFLHDSLKSMVSQEPGIQPVNGKPQQKTTANMQQSDLENLDKVKESAGQGMESELLSYLDTLQHAGTATKEKKLNQLLYVAYDDAFKNLIGEIVKKKFKAKNQESYELLKNKIRSLATKIPVKTMTDFLNACNDNGGVIDASSMITQQTKSNNIPLIDSRYLQIARQLLSLELPRIGRGEIGLAFMGIDAVKGVTDITVSGIDIEVKASSGKDFFMKGNADEGGFGNQAKAVAVLTRKLNTVGAEYKSNNRAGQGGIAAVGTTNINTFNNYFSKLGREGTIELIVDVLKALNVKSPETVNSYIKDISNSVSKDGTIDYNLLSLATAKINFDYYKKMSGHEGVLVLNLSAFQFLFISDAETWANQMAQGVLKQMYALDFRSNGLGGIAYKINTVQSAA